MKTRTSKGSENPIEEPVIIESEAQATQEAAVQAEIIEAESLSMTPVDAVREGATSAKAAAAELLPNLGKLVSKSVYGTFYYASYGVVFGALTVAHLIPTNNLMGAGLRDGAAAARRAFDQQQEAAAQTRQQAEMPDESAAVVGA